MCADISGQFGLLKFSALSAVLLINKINAQIDFLDFLNVIILTMDFSGSSHG